MKDIEYLHLTDGELAYLTIVKCGEEECKPNYRFDQYLKDFFLIHYVVRGKGEFQINGKKYKLSAGQGFLIPPNKYAEYVADEKDPWYYTWVAFTGVSANWIVNSLNISAENPVFRCKNAKDAYDSFDDLLYHVARYDSDFYGMMSALFRFFACIEKPKLTIDLGIAEQAAIFINSNYGNSNIKIVDVASAVSVSRSYLFRLFTQCFQMSPREYLSYVRISKAKEMLMYTDNSISQICLSCGFKEFSHFSHSFKESTGLSPSAFREENCEINKN